MTVSTVAVLGAGSWGTALGMQLARTGHNVRLWARDQAQAAAMQDSRINQRYLPDCRLPDSLQVSADPDETCAGADHILVAVPSHAFGATVERIAQYVNVETGLAWASKGFEPGTGRLLHEVARELVGRSEEHTSELQSRGHLVCRLLLEKQKIYRQRYGSHSSSRPLET